MATTKFSNDTILEIVRKLVGDIRPVGETNTDNIRFDNLKQLTEVVSTLVYEIDKVAYDFKDSHEYSVKIASEFAHNFITMTLGIKD